MTNVNRDQLYKKVALIKPFIKACLKANWKNVIIGAAILIGSLFFLEPDTSVSMIPVLLILAIGSLVIFFLGKNKAVNALLVIIGFGCLMAVMTPILDTPDETAHFSRAMYLVQGDLKVQAEDSQLLISQDYQIIKSEQGETVVNNDLSVADTSLKIVESDGLKATNAYSFISYIPQALGLGIGRFLNLTLLWSYYLGRITNVITYALLAAIAIRLTPVYKNIFFMIATMPMSVYLAASYNQDAFGMGMILLTIALFLFLLNKKDQSINFVALIIFSAFCMLITLSKFPYVLLVLLLPFIPAKKFKKPQYYALSYLMILLTAAFAVVWMKSYSSIPHPFVPEGVNMGKQIEQMLNDPIFAIRNFGGNMISQLTTLLMLFTFGWLTYGSNAAAIVYLIFLGSMILMSPQERVFTKLEKWGSGLVSLGIYTAILLSMYLTWTAVGETEISGLQGRYFIGMLPLLPVFLNIGPPLKKLDTAYQEKIGRLTTQVPILFIYFSLALTLVTYY
ncbi:MAG: hypothetical protein PWP62_1179 [Eubacteriaceae bacterium]|nr:hypothetical protein [Eubacteriaceae bacterium]MDK2962461.1 hypothetical protein [Eubacteriaceae bacterium]